MKTQIAYFVSSHGFGHAARSAAIMESLQSINPNIEFNIFTRIPAWFFANSKGFNFKIQDLPTDVGMAQKTALKEDIHETINLLNDYYPLRNDLLNRVSEIIGKMGCKLIICDISPLGIAAAKATGIKAVLVENFTWDWIYEKYKPANMGLNKHIDYLRNIYSLADFRIKTEPFCYESKFDITTYPVSRKPKQPGIKTREKLGLGGSEPHIMITMGGINGKYNYIDRLFKFNKINFIIPGISDKIRTMDNIILIPANSDFYHPDIVNASDAVIGKLGYSTLAEVYYAGVAFGYITREEFPESLVFENYINKNMNGLKITSYEFESGNWTDKIERLLSIKGISHNHPYGADQAARFINNLIV